MTDTRRAVVRALRDGPVDGPTLADELGVSRAAVWKHVEALRDAGFEVTSSPEGYAVTGVPEYGGLAVAYEMDADLDVEYHDALPSTNDRARELAADGRGDVVVLADEQTGGRGRRDRAWASPPGGVWASVLLRPDVPPTRAPLLTLAMAVAVADAAREAGVDAHIKWPNDVLVGSQAQSASDSASGEERPASRDDRKLAGILTEMEGEAGRVSWVIVGTGVNVNVDAETLPAGATSVQADAGPVERRRFVARTLERFDALRGDPDATLSAWRERASTLGRRVRVETPDGPVVGRAVDVTEGGALRVETADGERVVHAGDCEHLRPA
jgi:BirA family biotin operon repressor/biotin-[acetyl-CoA-carboxylase] ligase